MSDLNDWQLEVGAEVTQFGTAATDYPFSTQVVMSAMDRDVQDGVHPDVDGGVMGRDLLRGFDLQFDCRILKESPVTAKPWMNALDLYESFAAKWRAEAIRDLPGQYAILRNTERGRFAIGRPRDIAPKFQQVRKGYLDFQMDFRSVSPAFYRTESQIVTRVAEGSANITNEGSLPSWPVITITGAQGVVVSYGAVGNILWSALFDDPASFNQPIVIDTRPWSRSVSVAGAPGNGRLINGVGRVSNFKIPAGTGPLNFYYDEVNSIDPELTVEWHPAFASF